jgi:hypothetical protein
MFAMKKVLKVVHEEYYLIDMIDEERTVVNGWSLRQILKDWFGGFRCWKSHATRDYYKIGNATQIGKATVMTLDEFEEEDILCPRCEGEMRIKNPEADEPILLPCPTCEGDGTLTRRALANWSGD